MLFYLCRYTIKLLATEISVHAGNICSDIHGAYALNVRTSISSYGPRARLIRAYSSQWPLLCAFGMPAKHIFFNAGLEHFRSDLIFKQPRLQNNYIIVMLYWISFLSTGLLPSYTRHPVPMM